MVDMQVNRNMMHYVEIASGDYDNGYGTPSTYSKKIGVEAWPNHVAFTDTWEQTIHHLSPEHARQIGELLIAAADAVDNNNKEN